MAPEVVFTALRAVRTRFWVSLPVPSCRRYMKPASGQEISHYAPAEEFFNSLSHKRTFTREIRGLG